MLCAKFWGVSRERAVRSLVVALCLTFFAGARCAGLQVVWPRVQGYVLGNFVRMETRRNLPSPVPTFASRPSSSILLQDLEERRPDRSRVPCLLEREVACRGLWGTGSLP